MKSARNPWKHQQEALDALEGKKYFALLMSMRTGKTKVVLDDFVRLQKRGEVQDLLVIAPGGAYETWGAAVNLEIQDPPMVHIFHSGAGVAERRARAEFMATRKIPRVLVVNVEALSLKKSPARQLTMDFVRQRPTMVAIDESTIIKNSTANRTKFVLGQHSLKKPIPGLADYAPYRRIMTGLVTPRSPLDLFCQFKFLHWSILGTDDYYAFRARHCVFKKIKVKVKTPFGVREKLVDVIDKDEGENGYKNLEELTARIAPHSFRRRLEDCYDLPPKVYATRHVELTAEQSRLYAEMKKYCTAKLSEEAHVTATIVIAQMLKLHQILCGHAVDERGKSHEVPENKTRALLELLEEHEGKAIVWVSYDADVWKVARALNEAYGDGSAAKFWGGNRATREDEEKRFKFDPRCRFMVATPAAGGRGRTWDVADLVVYYSSTDDLEHRSQSEERPQAVGKARSVEYVDLIAPGTVEEKILGALKAKINLASKIVGDAWKEWIV